MDSNKPRKPTEYAYRIFKNAIYTNKDESPCQILEAQSLGKKRLLRIETIRGPTVAELFWDG
jgi:hypothetical protein